LDKAKEGINATTVKPEIHQQQAGSMLLHAEKTNHRRPNRITRP